MGRRASRAANKNGRQPRSGQFEGANANGYENAMGPPAGPGFQRKRLTTPATQEASTASAVVFSVTPTSLTAPVGWTTKVTVTVPAKLELARS